MEKELVKNDIKDLSCMFGRGVIGSIRVEAENAWLDGKDANANPYNAQTDHAKWWCWYQTWLTCNRYC